MKTAKELRKITNKFTRRSTKQEVHTALTEILVIAEDNANNGKSELDVTFWMTDVYGSISLYQDNELKKRLSDLGFKLEIKAVKGDVLGYTKRLIIKW